MSELKDLAELIGSNQAKARKRQEVARKKAAALVKKLEDGLRKLPQFKGDCPICERPCVVFGSHDYDWDARDAAKKGGFDYSDCVLSGSDVMHHDKCFFSYYGHLD